VFQLEDHGTRSWTHHIQPFSFIVHHNSHCTTQKHHFCKH
jgi:hypothetical protein